MERIMAPETIGDRIKTRRKLRGLSVRQAADFADIAASTWSRIERGERGADNLTILSGMAQALRCSVADLIGDGHLPVGGESVGLVDDVHDILAALVETDLGDEATSDPAPLDYLTREAALLEDLYRRGDFIATAARLAPFLRQLHATAVTAEAASDARRSLELTVLAAHRMMNVLRNVGQRADAYLAGERARDAANELEDAELTGIAAFTRAHAALGCGSIERGHKVAEAGLRALAGTERTRRAEAVAGQLHLTSAMCLYGLKRDAEAEPHLTEAEGLAGRTGDCGQDLGWFGPTNIGIWKLAIEVDSGDPKQAVRIARSTNAMRLPAPTRQASFYLDAGRAFARVGTREADATAVRMIATAERIAPQRVQFHPLAREALRVVVMRAGRSSIDSQLRGLCERIGVTA
ncbi:helix-turn-helix domain-containing protein [Glycomyces salinus]|uniref:helix-turn-helix domain-containing protein n=1 Tax=Glycomyces salinus TaxID=980294 RepID=UPI0018EA78EE|nr:helix-turn-helix transcriptional regulator [Glycomyces salinus]